MTRPGDDGERHPAASPAAIIELLSAAPQCTWEVRNETGPVGTILVLRLAGEIDLATVTMISGAVTAVFDRHPHDLIMDMSEVEFCCVRGFALLAATARTARTRHVGFAVSGLSVHLERIALLLWPERPCTCYRSAAAAVRAFRSDQLDRSA